MARTGYLHGLPGPLLIVFFFCSGAGAHAGAAPLFESQAPLSITLEGPFAKIARDRTGEPEWFPATLTVSGADGSDQALEIRIRARGKNRRKSEVCRFPPLRLSIDDKQASATVFAGQDKLKLVTHCEPSASFEQYVLREYLAYRLYNTLTDCSYRVRALDIVYHDVDRKKRKARSRVGFVIEDRSAVAQRCGGKYAKVTRIGRGELAPEASSNYELFQFLLGNTDWSLITAPEGERCCHNGILVRMPDSSYVPVPYDFDAAGFVNAPYAAPSEKLKIDSVTTRLFRGFCRPDNIIDATITRFNSLRERMFALVRDEPGLTNNTRRALTNYLERFFHTINDPRAREREIANECR